MVPKALLLFFCAFPLLLGCGDDDQCGPPYTSECIDEHRFRACEPIENPDIEYVVRIRDCREMFDGTQPFCLQEFPSIATCTGEVQ